MNVKSAVRTLQILKLLGERSRTHADLSSELGIPKSSLTGLIGTMTAGGFVSTDASGRRYRLGPEILVLAQRYLSGLDLVGMGQSAVRAISQATGEAAALVIRAGNDILVVAKENGERPIRRSMQVGERAPMAMSAAGRVFLAFMGQSERDAIIAESMIESALDQEGVARLEAHLKQVRAGELSYSREELLSGIIAMGAPVFDANGHLAGCLSVSAPVSRFDPALEKTIAKSLRQHSNAISSALGATNAQS